MNFGIYQPLINKFRQVPVLERKRDALYEAEIDLLTAEAAFEDAEAKLFSLRRRVARLSLPTESLYEIPLDTQPGVHPLP